MDASTPPPVPMDGYVPFAALRYEVGPLATVLRDAISSTCRTDEAAAVNAMLCAENQHDESKDQVQALARRLVESVRAKRLGASGVDALMHEYALSSKEGVALMCLAEALLRIPDRATANRLIADKIGKGEWRLHLGASPSLFVNAATWGLVVTGRLVATASERGLGGAINALIVKGGEPLVRKGMDLAMRMLGNQFVAGRTIEEALANSREREARGFRFSYDMLGEAALTMADADAYYAAYEQAIHAIGRAAHGRGTRDGPGISVKLSALHPRYARAQRERVMEELLPRLQALTLLARQYDIGLNIDAEEADRLELSLDLVEALAWHPALDGFQGLGVVVQAYQKRCLPVLHFLVDLARRSRRRLMIRLVKGAYWDAEIKRAQVDGQNGYPVYTRKAHTDVSYLTGARLLLSAADAVYPQFATHNAHTVATISTWARQLSVTRYEFQCLYGMGETLYDEVVGARRLNQACRIYAPVGSHETLLAYLVRRLLENGANTSFVNQVVDQMIPAELLVADPFEEARCQGGKPHPAIPLPAAIFGAERRNSAGIDLHDDSVLRELASALGTLGTRHWTARPLVPDAAPTAQARPVVAPADRGDEVGTVTDATAQELESALAAAARHAPSWAARSPAKRAAALQRAAELFEAQRVELMSLLVREAGRTVTNAAAEIREAVDYLRYYAAQSCTLPPAQALGPVVCISPWNFPLAIFTGQVGAALAAGNVVLAKPAEQTPLIACRAVELLHQAGVEPAALQLLPGFGDTVGAQLVADARVQGVLFTGSTGVARHINRTLAARMERECAELCLIAETGGQNAMIVDSSALTEQVVQDVLTSAFDSAGQRCSALRVLCLQHEIADRTLDMLHGAMRELRVGNPDRLATDIGPVIDAQAKRRLESHVALMRTRGNAVQSLPDVPDCDRGTFVMPCVIEIGALPELREEVFGPVLHVLRYRREELPQLVDAINATGYGLTMGIQSRIDETIDFITARAKVGNIYVNRNMIGAAVGVQPFGGEGLSGTGPKAGGPLYLHRLRRASAPQPGALIVDGPPLMSPVFDEFAAWLKASGAHDIALLAERYRSTTLSGTTLPLPGPTGERNTLTFVARGTILCAAATRSSLQNQIAAVLATGNRIAVTAASVQLMPAALHALLRVAMDIVDEPERATASLHGGLIDCELPIGLHGVFARRDGPLVPVIMTRARTPIPLWRLIAERALCVNTAAAGGNATLLSLRP